MKRETMKNSKVLDKENCKKVNEISLALNKIKEMTEEETLGIVFSTANTKKKVIKLLKYYAKNEEKR